MKYEDNRVARMLLALSAALYAAALVTPTVEFSATFNGSPRARTFLGAACLMEGWLYTVFGGNPAWLANVMLCGAYAFLRKGRKGAAVVCASLAVLCSMCMTWMYSDKLPFELEFYGPSYWFVALGVGAWLWAASIIGVFCAAAVMTDGVPVALPYDTVQR